MNFLSDNVAGGCPEVIEAITKHNDGATNAYGDDELTRSVEGKIQDIFETECAVFLIATGTAANALSLSVLTPPYGAVYCYEEAHVQMDECGAPEFYTGGAKLLTLPGADGKITADVLDEHASRETHGYHHVKQTAVTITQATCCGTVYTLDQVQAVSAVARKHGYKVHMDGARFTNALVSLDCSPAEITWKSGVDVLSFGATKNGALAAEAVVLFDKSLADEFAYRRKRAGHLFSKMRFMAAQMDGYLTDDVWLRNGRHANAMAARLAAGLESIPGISMVHSVDANELFVEIPVSVIEALNDQGFTFYQWPSPERSMARMVTAFNTKADDVDALISAARTVMAARAA